MGDEYKKIAFHITLYSLVVVLLAIASHYIFGYNIEYIRTFSIWMTMTIGMIGLYIAIRKFDIDAKNYKKQQKEENNKKLKLILKKDFQKDENLRAREYSIHNRLNEDVYIKNFQILSNGDVQICPNIELEYNFNSPHFVQWNWEGNSFHDVRSGEVMHDILFLEPNKKIDILLKIANKEDVEFTLRIEYTMNEYDGVYEVPISEIIKVRSAFKYSSIKAKNRDKAR